MANIRKAGARMLARLAAGLCLVSPLAAFADDGMAPFPEYSGDDRWSPLAAEAAHWQMSAICSWERYVGCTVTEVRTTATGYLYRYVHSATRPGGGGELVEGDGGGNAAWSCPAGYTVYATFMGMEVGPYPNRMLDMHPEFPVTCKREGAGVPIGAASPWRTGPVAGERFDRGHLLERHVEGGEAATWSVAWDAAGAGITGRGQRWVSEARIEQGRVVSLGSGLQLEYDTEGALDTVRGLGGTVFSRDYVNDPEGKLVAALRTARRRLPEGAASAPLDALARAGQAIDALLDGGP